MSNQEIKEALEQIKGITTLDHSQLTPKQVQAFRDIDCFAHEWLSHQATLIDQQAVKIANYERHANEFIYGESEEGSTHFEKINSSLELAVKALEQIAECGTTGEDAMDMHRIVAYALESIKGNG